MQNYFTNTLKQAEAEPVFVVGKTEIFRIRRITPEIEMACVSIAALGFSRSEETLRHTVIEHVNDGELYLGVCDVPVAFRILQERKRGIVYLAGAVKSPGSERGLVTNMTKGLLSCRELDFVITRTGNDLVLDEMLEICEQVVAFNKGVNPGVISLICEVGLMSEHLQVENLVIPNCYGGEPMLNPVMGRPGSKSEKVKQFMRQVLPDQEYFSGGAVMLVGKK